MIDAPRILIIDDSRSECLYMSQALQKAGYRVESVLSGQEGVAKTIEGRPQCVILDVILPGMNGYEVCRHIRAHSALKNLPIIMVSTKNTLLDTNWGLRQGASRYLAKPFSQETLVKAVWEVLTKQKQTDQSFSTGLEKASHQGLDLQQLVVQRVVNSDILRGSNPNAVVISDKTARRIYNSIDGRNTVERLCQLSLLTQEQVYGALRLLLEQQRIQFIGPDGRQVNVKHLLPDH